MQAASKRPRQPLLPMQPYRSNLAARRRSGPEGHALQAPTSGMPDTNSSGLDRHYAPAAAKRSAAQHSGSLGGSQQPEDSRPDARQAHNSAFCSSAAARAAEGVSKAPSVGVLAAAPAQPAQPPSGQGAGQSTWQAFMDDVDELQCDATPGKQQRPHSSWQATAACAANLDEASFATRYD